MVSGHLLEVLGLEERKHCRGTCREEQREAEPGQAMDVLGEKEHFEEKWCCPAHAAPLCCHSRTHWWAINKTINSRTAHCVVRCPAVGWGAGGEGFLSLRGSELMGVTDTAHLQVSRSRSLWQGREMARELSRWLSAVRRGCSRERFVCFYYFLKFI